MPSLISAYSLEIRDVSEKEEWAAAHAGEVPVITIIESQDGPEVSTAVSSLQAFHLGRSCRPSWLYDFFVLGNYHRFLSPDRPPKSQLRGYFSI